MSSIGGETRDIEEIVSPKPLNHPANNESPETSDVNSRVRGRAAPLGEESQIEENGD